MLKEKSICFTGHRKIDDDHYYRVVFLLNQIVEEKIKEGYTVFCAGGALGFDTLAALAVLRMKNRYKNVKLHLYLPCKDQSEKWHNADKEMYKKIIKEADKVVYLSEKYTPFCMAERNRALVDNSSLCVAYCTQPKGGTAYTIGYAMDNDVEVINLAQMIENKEI